MPNTRPPYPAEFKAEAVRLVTSSGKPLSTIARDLGVSVESLRIWVRQQEGDTGQRQGRSTEERQELRRRRRENRILREILKKAAACFARETQGNR